MFDKHSPVESEVKMLRNWFEWSNPTRHVKKRKFAAKDMRPARGKVRLFVEQLEERETPSAVSWIGGATGFWDVAANWSGNTVPTSADDVSINTAAAAAITIRAGDAESINSLTIGNNSTLSITGGSLSVAGTLSNTGAIIMATASSLTVAGAYSQAANATLSLPSNGVPNNPTTNLFANPDFESPVNGGNGSTLPTGWTDWNTAYLSTQYAYTGSQSLEGSGGGSEAYQTFSATPGASYTLSVDAMTPASNPLTGSEAAYIQVEFFNASGQQLTGYTAPNAVTVLTSLSAPGGSLPGSVGGQGWNQFSTTVTAPAGAATVQALLVVGTYNGSGPGGGAVYWDDAQFGPAVSGPSTFSAGSVSNAGDISVGPRNSIKTSGAFTQTSTGTLDLQLGGAPVTGYDGSVSVGGAASLGGTLKSEVVFGYVPSTTDSFTPITFPHASGAFTNAQLPSGSGYQFEDAVTFTNVVLSAVPTTPLTTTVNAADVLHSASPNLLGVNLTYWDGTMDNAQTEQLVEAAGLTMFRFPGGSSSDDYHFNNANNYYTGSDNLSQFVQFIQTVNGAGVITVDYGSGSPQEAAAELAYLQGSPTDTTQIGVGIQWNDSTGQWQNVNWGTVGYWASLRAASPLSTNDGLNFLRVDHPAPFTDIKYWEIGNEQYGGWELDHHGTVGPGGVSTGGQHIPATYAAFAAQFAKLATEITTTAGVPSISIGIDSGDPTGLGDNFWTKNVLTDGLADGFVPNFISDHSYMQAPGGETDAFLLNDTATNPTSVLDWTTRYADYETLLQSTLGSQAANVQFMATEFNSVNTNPGKQSTSLVDGLSIAETLGSMLDSGYVGADVWDLRNGWGTSYNNSNTLYGWREGGDYGLLGGSNQAPSTGTYEPYPSYFAEQLASKIIQSGGQVVSVATNYQDFDAYGVLEPNGHLDLLVINTNPSASLNEQFNIAGFQPNGQATVWQYGEAQDTAQSQSSTGATALANFSATLSINGDSFTYSFPAYSMTVIDLTPGAVADPPAPPAVSGPATATVDNAQTFTFSGGSAFSVSDAAATASTLDTVALHVGNGTLNVNLGGGATIVAGANNSATLTINGTLTQLDAALGALTYTAAPTGASDTLTVVAADGSVSSAPFTTAITLVDSGPTVLTPAGATPAAVTGVSTSLSVLGADPAGESTLVYTWSTTGTPPATVQFSGNGTNAAQDVTATFTEAGTYNFLVTIADAGGLTTTSSVSVTVLQTLGSIVVTPSVTTIPFSATDTVAAMAFDQFGQAMAVQPSFAWSASGGAVTSAGVFMAPGTGGVYDVSAASGSVTGSAAITVSGTAMVAIGAPSALLTASGPISFAVTINDANFNAASLSAASFKINSTGTAAAAGVALMGSGNSRILTLSGITGDGTLGVTLPAGAVSDLAGNTNDATIVSSTFSVDNTPPTTTITTEPSLYSNSTTASFSFVGADPTVNGVSSGVNQLQYELDGGTFTQTSSPLTLTGLANGAHTLEVRAVDNAGNIGPAASFTWTVVTTPPTVVIGAPSVASTAGGPVNYSVTVTDAYFNPATLTAGSFTLNATGTATGTLALTGTGNSWTLTVSGINGSGTLGVTLAAHSIADLAGNTNAAAVVGAPFNVANGVAPVVTSVVVNGGTAPIISAAESGNTVTVQTDGPSGFSVGESVLIAGVGTGYNGAHVITAVKSNTEFTYTAAAGGLARAVGGTATPAETTSGLLNGKQRSMVDSIVYTFSEPVMLAANAFTLVVHSGGNAGGTVPTVSYGSPDGGRTWVVTFSGAGVEGDSIANGAYDITLNNWAASAVSGGSTLESSRTDTFYRLFGDVFGYRTVYWGDQNVLTAALWTHSTSAGFNAALDFDDNGVLNWTDNTALIADKGVRFSGFTATI